MKKKIVSGILILAMLLSVAGCEADSDYPGVDNDRGCLHRQPLLITSA